jgi:hypothetical protein
MMHRRAIIKTEAPVTNLSPSEETYATSLLIPF